MRVSFDFDGTLSRVDVQEFAKELVADGHEVWIVSSRSDMEIRMNGEVIQRNVEVYNIAKECGINNVYFTNLGSKIYLLENKGFSFHLDDDDVELMDILESKDVCMPIDVNCKEWKEICKTSINLNKKYGN